MMPKPKAIRLPAITEKAFMAQVVQLARVCRWRVYHTHDSRRSVAGFPDLVLVRGPRLLAIELKARQRQKATVEQLAWLEAFAAVPGVTALLWRPSDWPQIERVLMGENL